MLYVFSKAPMLAGWWNLFEIRASNWPKLKLIMPKSLSGVIYDFNVVLERAKIGQSITNESGTSLRLKYTFIKEISQSMPGQVICFLSSFTRNNLPPNKPKVLVIVYILCYCFHFQLWHARCYHRYRRVLVYPAWTVSRMYHCIMMNVDTRVLTAIFSLVQQVRLAQLLASGHLVEMPIARVSHCFCR